MTLPDWPEGTVCVLTTAEAHAIPVSTAIRAGAQTVVFGLGRRRGSLERLRADPRCALTVMAEGVAFTAYGTAEEAGVVEGVVAVRLEVTEVVDHMTADFAVKRGIFWHWTQEQAATKDAAVREALRGLAE